MSRFFLGDRLEDALIGYLPLVCYDHPLRPVLGQENPVISLDNVDTWALDLKVGEYRKKCPRIICQMVRDCASLSRRALSFL